ncbi:hypothetical protein D3C72_2255460 [compost metagenome]
MWPATSRTPAKSTSPHSLPASSRFMPTSMTTAPGLTISAVMMLRRPTAATITSASRVWAARSRVLLLQIVTVAPACSSSMAIGLPTMFEAPTTTARAPRSGYWIDSSIFMHP